MMLQRLRRLFGRASPPTLSSVDAYARWAASYPPQAHNPLMQAEEAAMLNLFPPMQGQVVLDLACGTGRYGIRAAEHGAKTIIGLDNSPAMLQRNTVQYRALASSEAIPLPNESIDGILCGLALGHLPQLRPSISEISRVLKPGGWALVSDFHPLVFLRGNQRTFTAPDGRTYAVEHYAHLYSDYFQAAREAGLIIEDIAEPRLDLPRDGRSLPVVIVFRFTKKTDR